LNKTVRRQHVPVWMYLLVTVGMELLWIPVIWRKNTGLFKERLHPGPGAKDSLCSVFLFYLPPWLGHYAVAWLDRTRLHRSDRVPPVAQIFGLVGVAVSTAIALWAMTVNPFFSSVVRIQRDRGQHVISSGPYHYVRHPGYASGMAMAVFSPLALGSWLSLIPAALSLPFVLRRVILEDKVLHDELEGYKDYAKSVRHRIVPGVW